MRGWLNLLRFHNFCNFLELGAIGADKHKAIFLALLLGGSVKLAAHQSKQQFFGARKLPPFCKSLVGTGSQTHQPPSSFQNRKLMQKL